MSIIEVVLGVLSYIRCAWVSGGLVGGRSKKKKGGGKERKK